jgi:hypothetical protein
MSFILDSLKQLEREKKAPQAPDLSLLHGPPKPPAWRRWVGLAFMGILIANLIGWLWFVNTDRMARVPSEKTKATAASDGQARLPDQKAATHKPDAAPRASSTTRSLQAETRVRASKPRPQTSTNPSQPSATTKAAPSPPPAVTKAKVAETDQASPAPPSPSASVAPDDATVAAPATPPPPPDPIAPTADSPPPAPAEAQSPVATTPPDKPLTPWNNLALEVRAQLNSLEINVHSYDPDPAGRMVFINMRRYNEGERIGRQGPLLHAITAEGIVVDVGDARVLVPVAP